MQCNRSQLQADRDKTSISIGPNVIYRRPSSIRDPTKKMKNPVIDERSIEENFKEAPNAIISSKPKDEKDIQLISNVLRKHYIFNSIDRESQMVIIKKVKCYEIGAKELIFEQGQPGVCFFIVSSGKLEVKAGNEKSILGPGMSFGELALMDDRPRTATVRTIEACVLWGLDRKTFMRAVKKIRIHEYEDNKKLINSVSIFDILTSSQKESLLSACVTQKRSTGDVIVKETDSSDLFFIVKEGVAVCTTEKNESREIHKGDFFGEHALMYQVPRMHTVVAATEVRLISISKENLLEVLGNSLEHILFRNSQKLAIDNSSALKSLSIKQKEAIIDKTRVKKYQSGEVVIQKDSYKAHKLFIVISGKLVGPREYSPLQCVGDEDIVSKAEDVYEGNHISLGESNVAEISVQEIEMCIGGEISQITIHNDAVGVLRQVQLLRGLSQDRINALTLALKITNFEDRQVIVQQSNPGHSFFIIKSGSVKVMKNEKFIRSITKNDYFGERSVLFNDFRTATVLADGPVSCWTLERDDFMNIIIESIREKLIKRIEMQDTSVLLEELIPVRAIGTGVLGNVTLAVHNQKKSLYALKSLTRNRIEEYHIHNNLILEKNILMELDHIMIIKLIKTFKDPSRIYFLMEYVRGKDLFDVLLELGQVSEEQSKFYAACLMVTLDYLHERNIIHRDLKPENIIIDDEGYTKLIDFGAAAIVEGRTYTAIGTPHYLAPEIILRVGYSYAVDWWSLGVMIHEMVFGHVPFGSDDEDPLAIYDKILEGHLNLENLPYKSNHFKNILTQLLNKNPAARTCGGFGYLKSNSWFGNLNWDRLMSRQLRPPYTPKCQYDEEEIASALQNPRDLDNFLNDVENAQNTLIYKKRTQGPPGANWDDNF